MGIFPMKQVIINLFIVDFLLKFCISNAFVSEMCVFLNFLRSGVELWSFNNDNDYANDSTSFLALQYANHCIYQTHRNLRKIPMRYTFARKIPSGTGIELGSIWFRFRWAFDFIDDLLRKRFWRSGEFFQEAVAS